MTRELLKVSASGHSSPTLLRFSSIMKTVRPLLLFCLASFVTADDAYHIDFNSGVQTQQESEKLDANELSYTTSGGVPSVHSI